MSILPILANDKTIPYRPAFNAITGNVLGSIFLQQVLYRWFQNGRRPFYKFNEPCQHSLYRDGDSWVEELGFTISQFYTARQAVACRVHTGDSKTELRQQYVVLYWRDKDDKLWYELNEELLLDRLNETFLEDSEVLATPENPSYISQRKPEKTTTPQKENTTPDAQESSESEVSDEARPGDVFSFPVETLLDPEETVEPVENTPGRKKTKTKPTAPGEAEKIILRVFREKGFSQSRRLPADLRPRLNAGIGHLEDDGRVEDYVSPNALAHESPEPFRGYVAFCVDITTAGVEGRSFGARARVRYFMEVLMNSSNLTRYLEQIGG